MRIALREPLRRVPLALVHHANQYVITDGYADRQGMREILGLAGAPAHRAGIVPLLRMHLEYGVPLSLHVSGTLLETMAWHAPESLRLISLLLRAGLFEMVGSAFSQNIMPLFDEDQNRRQLDEELWLVRRHLGCAPERVKVFWVPERVWDTEKLARIIACPRLLNGGYRYVLLDDRLVHPVGDRYEGSPRERFDREGPSGVTSFQPWRIAGGHGLVMLPISYRLRYLVPPPRPEAFDDLSGIFSSLAASTDERAIVIYGDDLEKAAGVGGWDTRHPERYERFLRWLCTRPDVQPVLLGAWADRLGPAGVRPIERGTFFELARSWNAGEDYRGWHEDPAAATHRRYLAEAAESLARAEASGGDRGLIELGWRHYRHCSFETSWHRTPGSGRGAGLEAWACALASHARSCGVIARAAEWFAARDGQAHAELVDVDGDGEVELVLQNSRVLAVFSPVHGGRLTYLFDLTGRIGRLVVGNVSDDWNLQEALNQYMDLPRNHPGAFADVGHEHDRYDAEILASAGGVVSVRLRNREAGSALLDAEKHIALGAGANQLSVTYTLPPTTWRLSTEVSLSPDYFRLLREGRRGLSEFNGPDWRGWRNRGARAWLRIDRREGIVWDAPYRPESGHALNLRVTSFTRRFHLQLGVGVPAGAGAAAIDRRQFHGPPSLATARDATSPAGVPPVPAAPAGPPGDRGRSAALRGRVTNARFLRSFFNRTRTGQRLCPLPVGAVDVRIIKPHHDRLTLEYVLSIDLPGSQPSVTRPVIGNWRQDDRGLQIHELLERLWQAGFDGRDGFAVPKPLGYAGDLHLMLTEKSPGVTLKQYIRAPGTDWTGLVDRVAVWLRRLHRTQIEVPLQFTIRREVDSIAGWLHDIHAAGAPWIQRERSHMTMLLREVLARQLAGDLTRRSLIHGDFHPENILIRGHLVSVIDFEHGMMGDPAMDLGYFLAEVDIQADRYWSGRGRESPIDIERLASDLLARYGAGERSAAHAMVDVFRARTYLKHLVHTIRMQGSEPADRVARYLKKAERCLASEGSIPALRVRMARAALPLRPRFHVPSPASGPAGLAV